MIILGIDPGVHGALAWYDSINHRLTVVDMPTVAAKRGKSALDVDGIALTNIIKSGYTGRCVVEQVTSRPRQGGQFSFGVNYGRVLGVLEALGIPIVHASAQKWKQSMGLRGQDKSMSVRLACELFPSSKHLFYGPRGAELDGRAEAALLAYYGSK
jgi:hypothetical protein